MNYQKTYGVIKSWHKGKERWFVRCDGKTTSLHYAKEKKAWEESEAFVRHAYKPFIRDMGGSEQVTFTFEKEVIK